MEEDILFQIDMELYNEFNDKFCEINEHFGNVYTYKDLQDLKEAESTKERILLRQSIENLIARNKELEEISKEQANKIEDYMRVSMILKSKVRKKIEEAQERIEDIKNQDYITCDEDEEMYILETKNACWKELLQELLEERN